MVRKFLTIVCALLMLTGSALGEYGWDREFPTAPENLTSGYTVEFNPQIRHLAEEALKTLDFPASGISWKDGELFAQDRPEDTGERATLRYNSRGELHYSKDTQTRKESDPNDALRESVAFAGRLLGDDRYLQGIPRIDWYYSEEGHLMTNIYDFVWPMLTTEGVPVETKSLTVTYSNGLVSSLHLWDGILTPADIQTTYPYRDAQMALDHLNKVALSAEHSSTLDDPADVLERLYLAYTSVFSQDGIYTPAWAFKLRDANSHQPKATVFVELSTGRVYDGRRILN